MDIQSFDIQAIEMHMTSYHVQYPGENYRYNEQNPGLGFLTSGNWEYGFYRNSFGRDSVYVVKRFRINKIFAADVGIASGYADPMPVGGLVMQYEGFSLRMAPHPDFGIGVYALSYLYYLR